MTCDSCGEPIPDGASACPRCGRAFTAPPVIHLGLEGPRRQNRLTVFFRWFLAIPHLLWLLVLWFVAFFAVVAGWFAALVLGRLPDGIRHFVHRVVNHTVRVEAYAQLLLTDRYPPFALDASYPPVAVVLPPATRLNRVAVLFRIVLQIPAMIVVQLLSGGIQIVMFFGWIVVLVKGRIPEPLFLANAAVLRYQTRAYGYSVMLTPEYPRGLFGDGPAPEATLPDEAEAVPSEVSPRITRFVLTKAARRIVVLVLVLGVLTQVGSFASGSVTSGQGERAVDRLEDAEAELEAASRDFAAESQTCAFDGGPECVRGAVDDVVVAIEDFRTTLADIDMPQGALPYAADVDAEAVAMLDALDRLVSAGEQQQAMDAASDLQEHGARFDEALAALRRVLVF